MFNVRIPGHSSSIQHVLERMKRRQELESKAREAAKKKKEKKANE